MIPSPTHRLADQLGQLHQMETRMATEFPVLAGSVMHTRLRGLLSRRARQARDRRDQVAGLTAHLGHLPQTAICPAIKGIIAEGNRELAAVHDPCTRDLAMLVHWMRIEQYAIAAYGIAVPIANRIGFPLVADRMNALLSDLTSARPSLLGMEAVVSRIAERHHAPTVCGKLGSSCNPTPIL